MRYGLRLGWPHGLACLFWCPGHGQFPPCAVPWLDHGLQDWSKSAERYRQERSR